MQDTPNNSDTDMVEAEYIDVEGDNSTNDDLHGVLQTSSADLIIPLPEGITIAQAVHMLSSRIPNNEFGLPVYFYRSDFLAPSLGRLTQQALDCAAVGLFYNDGYPTLDSGLSYWSQLPHEDYKAYGLFMKYIDQAEEYGIRQLDLLSGATGEDLDRLRELYQTYYWSSRARAHDLFITAAEAKKREHRIRKMENKHFDKTEGLITRLMARFEDENWIDELTAKEAIEAMETLVKIQRLSVGLTGQHSSSTQATPQGASTEYIMRRITKDANAALSGGSANNLQARMRELLSDSESGMVLQETILKLSTVS